MSGLHLIDTHVHLDYDVFDADRSAVIGRAVEAGVREMISIGTRLDSSRRAVALAAQYPEVHATVGIHPTEAYTVEDGFIEELRVLARAPRVAAIGEIGLDFYRLPESGDPAAYKNRQEEVFRVQLDLAVEVGLNVVIHQRASWEECVRVLKDYTGRVHGVFHCFGGTLEQAREILDLGHLVSFTGIVSFKNGRQVQETAKALPLEAFMVETDCPYLAPVPHRGQRCEPGHARLVADKIAALKGIRVEVLAERSTQTAHSFFRLGA